MTKMEKDFNWEQLIDLSQGRENLGSTIPISIYRLFEFSMRASMQDTYGKEAMIALFRKAGRIAGTHFTKENLDLTLAPGAFVNNLQQMFLKFNMGIIRFEELDLEKGTATITVSEDIDCSGLPIIGETVCNYDEGFLAAVLGAYTKKNFEAIEIDCWAKGDRICRFQAKTV